jgi:hypothetical protein
MTRVSTVHKGHPIRCQAFDLQLQRKDVKKYVGKLCEAFPGTAPQRLMLHRDRNGKPRQFAAAIQMQAQYQDGHKVIAINGISEMEMLHFEKILEKEFPSIKQSYRPTPQTEQILPGSP